MQSIINSLAVLAFLGVALLLFGCATLLKMVRDLQAALAAHRGELLVRDREHLAVPELAANAPHLASYVLVVDGNCPACHHRATRLKALAKSGVHARLIMLTADEKCREWLAGGDVEVLVDPALLGRIGISVMPTLVKYDVEGREEWRRIVGSDEDLDRLVSVDTSVSTP